ncbi:MAG: hypothetical protein IPM79_21285 [Polyangiaceae bacterium]|nr:hypothetical protein [Polyangiaceae bacterium]
MNKVEIGVLVAAMCLHGGGLAVARSMPEVHVLQPRFTEAMVMEFEMPTAVVPPAPKVVPQETVPQPVSPEQQAIAVVPPDPTQPPDPTSRPKGVPSESPGAAEPSSGGPLVTATGPSAPDEGWSVPGGEGPAGFGPGFGGPGSTGTGVSGLAASIAVNNAAAPAAPTEAPKAAKVDRDAANRVIKDELRKKDKNLGLDLPAAGTIASLIKSAVQASEAPGDSRATFTVALGPGGKVTSVTVGAFSGGGAATWQAVANQVKAALASRKLNLTEDYKKGAIVVVNASSKMQMPSGAEPGAGIKLSLTQTFDVADIGASPVRVVKVSFSSKPVE